MSYEGYEEYLCKNGHYSSCDCYCSVPKCPYCGSKFEFWHPVDQTNGAVEEDPSTRPALKEEAGFDDEWREDHYGNKYSIPIPRYAPGNGWLKCR